MRRLEKYFPEHLSMLHDKNDDDLEFLQISGKLLGSSMISNNLSNTDRDSLIKTIRVQKKHMGNLKYYLHNLSKKLPESNYEKEELDIFQDQQANYEDDEDFYRADFQDSMVYSNHQQISDSNSINEYGLLPSIRQDPKQINKNRGQIKQA
jgi:hypothetical protein